MSKAPHSPTEPPTGNHAEQQPRRQGWQFGLRSLLLLTAAIAVWVAFFNNRRQIAALEARIEVVRPLAHELIIDDVSRIAVVKLEEMWFGENQWNVYLPEGMYRLCVATRGIDVEGLASVAKSEPLKAGQHHVTLEQQRGDGGWRITVTNDESELLTVEEPKEWNNSSGWEGGGQFTRCVQLAADEPVVLFRSRFTESNGKGGFRSALGPTEGLLLWIEPMNESVESK